MKKLCGFIQSASAFGVLAGFIMTILSTAGIWVLIGSAVAGTAAMVTEMGIEQGVSPIFSGLSSCARNWTGF